MKSPRIYGDETSHKQAGEALWPWTALSLTTVVSFTGKRTKELFRSVIGPELAGRLISDGYRASIAISFFGCVVGRTSSARLAPRPRPPRPVCSATGSRCWKSSIR